MHGNIQEGDIVWTPSELFKDQSNLRQYMHWLARTHGLQFADYAALWQWSVTEIEAFWQTVWDYFEMPSRQMPAAVLTSRAMPAAKWFEGATLNYTERVFNPARPPAAPAILFRSETRGNLHTEKLSWADLQAQVTAIANALRAMGVQKGDCVAAYLPNMPEAVVAFLATASIGAIWSSCSPDMGTHSVLERIAQIQPKVLFAIDGYVYNGKRFDKRDVVEELVRQLPALEHLVAVPYLLSKSEQPVPKLVSNFVWADLLQQRGTLAYEPLDFNHPLWVLYSSGSTGLPKPIVHSQGGIVLEHLKATAFHCDLKAGDLFFWHTTTGWMMWNFLVGGLLQGCTICLFDGSPSAQNMRVLWNYAQEERVNYFGTSAAYIGACINANLGLTSFDLSALRSIGSTGSPLSVEGFAWVYAALPNVWLNPISGGTDVCTAFVGGNPLLPVRAGEMQCRYLGAAVYAFDDAGKPLQNEAGELVLVQPMPCMPICFWNDVEHTRYRESYFETYPNVWRHGDWVKMTPEGGVVIYGRSDSTINRQGVRVGTAEFYRVVERVPEIADSLIVDLQMLGRASYMPLFVVLRDGVPFDDTLKQKINTAIRQELSARQLPDEIVRITEVPRTLNGKKMEVPIKKILLGLPVQQAVNLGAMSNPHALDFFVHFQPSKS